MVNRKMRFVWNLGGGVGEVTHPLPIQTAGDLSKDQHWYRVEAERYFIIYCQGYNSLLFLFLYFFQYYLRFHINYNANLGTYMIGGL